MMPNNQNCDVAMSCDGGVRGDNHPSPPLPRQPTTPRPQQGLCFFRSPPAFLIKTYEMADDPDTNDIISWSTCGTSLIVSNHIKLAEEILPKYFKHNNFASFIYQLSNYGFRKIGMKQWEYENKWFQRGQKQLLVNIKRRDTTSKTIKRRCSRKRSMDDVANDDINSNIAAYKEEIQKLKEQQALVQDNIALFKSQVELTKSNLNKILTFLAKAYGNIIDKDATREIEKNGKNTEGLASTDYSSKDNLLNQSKMEANNFTTETNASRSSQENNFWRNFLGVDGQGENESGHDFIRNQLMANMEIDYDMMEHNMGFTGENEHKPPKMDAEEVDLNLWT